MGQAKLYGQNKGGMSINGIIKDYYAYAGENISAGDLVEYLNGVAGKVDYGSSTDTQLSTTTDAGQSISAITLSNNRVLILYRDNNIYLRGQVAKIDGITIIKGTETVLSTVSDAGYSFSPCLLPNGDVFIAHRGSSSEKLLYAMIVSIDDITITVHTDIQLSSVLSSGLGISVCTLPNGNVFIAHGRGTSNNLYGMICSISGTTISIVSDTQLVSSCGGNPTPKVCLLPDGNVFVAHRYNSKSYLYAIVVSINETTITTGADKAVEQVSYSANNFDITLLENGNVFVVHSTTSDSYYISSKVCSVSGTTITVTSNYINNDMGEGQNPCTVALPNNYVFIGQREGYSTIMYGRILKIEGTKATIVGEKIKLNNDSYSANNMKPLLLDNGTVFMAHDYSSNHHLYAQIFGVDYENNIPTTSIVTTEYETQVRKVTTAQFDGIAKTSGEGGDNTGHKDIVSIWTKEG